MAQYENGILGPVRGKVGPVVGRIRKGQYVMAIYRKHVSQVNHENNPKSLLQRAKWALAGIYASMFSRAVAVGFKSIAWQNGNGQSPVSIFVKKIFEVAISGSTPETVSIDPATLPLSAGSLPPVSFGTLDFSEAAKVTAPFTPNSEIDGALDTDLVYAVAYCPEKEAAYMAKPALRSAGSITVNVPANWAGKEVHIYGFVTNAENDSASNSEHLGTGTIA